MKFFIKIARVSSALCRNCPGRAFTIKNFIFKNNCDIIIKKSVI